MKVVLISHYPPPNGGIASWTKRLLEIGLPENWEIMHINSNMVGGRDPFKNTKVNLMDEIKRSLSIWSKEIKCLKDRDAKIVHTCIPCTLLGMVREIITGSIAKIKGRKFILHCRCTVPNVVNSGLKKNIFRLLAGLCDGIVVLNQKSLDFVASISKTDVELIPNFVSESELQDGAGKEYKEKLQDVVYAGGVTSDKGCDVILKAALKLKDITFHLIGNVSSEIESLDKPDNVIFYGNQDKRFVQDMLLKADAFIFFTRFWGEGFSNSLVEAMAAGLPCIVSDWAANRDMIGNDGGVVCDIDDVAGLISGIEKLKLDKEQRCQMGKRNIKKVRDEYVEKVVIPQYAAFYNELVDGKKIKRD